ncbi:MAG: hypothetical protein QXS68_06300 [Candidatus Methanomethylicaceae archaeon]
MEEELLEGPRRKLQYIPRLTAELLFAHLRIGSTPGLRVLIPL